MPLGLEGDFEPRKEAVEGVPEFLELVFWAVEGQPLVQAGGGDPPGRPGDGPDWLSIRQATSQPVRRASTATMARAIPELTRS